MGGDGAEKRRMGEGRTDDPGEGICVNHDIYDDPEAC